MSNHELISLRSAHPESKRDIAWQAMMVEFGLDFAFDENYQLPAELPASLIGVKAVATNTDSHGHYMDGPMGERLRTFAESGGVLFRYRGPVDQSPIDEGSTRGDMEMLIASAELTPNHPRLRKRLQSRTFRVLYEALLDPYFAGQIEGGFAKGLGDIFNEPYAYGILHTMETFDEYDPKYGWHDRLRDLLDRILRLAEPVVENIDATTGLPVLVRMSAATGDSKYRDFAARIVRKVAGDFPRIAGVVVLHPWRDRILWNESLAHFPPACVAVGDKDLVDLAVHTAHKLHELNYDPKLKLWRHWGAPGRKGPAIWARGQGWALTGLTGMLRYLDEHHPARPDLIGYIDQIADGLAATQNDEGLWHNVLDMPQVSRVACRASAMFIYCLAEARRSGWIEGQALDDMLHRGWRGLRGRVWRDKLCTVCCGTGAGATLHSYLSRPMLFYGASSALRAGANYVLTYGEDQP